MDSVSEPIANPTVLTVLLNWRTAEMTLRAADAAERAMEGVAGGIVVVDNDSGDGSFERMRDALKDRPRFRVVQSGRNGGFGAGNNVGIRLGLPDGSRPDYVYILNSDAFPAPDAIRLLLDYLQRHPTVGIAGSYIHGPDGEPHVTCFRFPSVASEFEGAARTGPISRLLAGRSVAIGVPDATGPVDWLAGASMMIRDVVLREIGDFDETFFLYFEETDLCRRAVGAGYELWAVGEAVARHIGGTAAKASGEPLIYGASLADPFFRSRYYYLVKHFGWPAAAFTEVAEISLLAGKSLLKRLTGRDAGGALAERLAGPVMRKPTFPS